MPLVELDVSLTGPAFGVSPGEPFQVVLAIRHRNESHTAFNLVISLMIPDGLSPHGNVSMTFSNGTTGEP